MRMVAPRNGVPIFRTFRQDVRIDDLHVREVLAQAAGREQAGHPRAEHQCRRHDLKVERS